MLPGGRGFFLVMCAKSTCSFSPSANASCAEVALSIKTVDAVLLMSPEEVSATIEALYQNRGSVTSSTTEDGKPKVYEKASAKSRYFYKKLSAIIKASPA